MSFLFLDLYGLQTRAQNGLSAQRLKRHTAAGVLRPHNDKSDAEACHSVFQIQRIGCPSNRLGVRYNRKAVLGGSNQDRLKQAARAALTACQRLEAEPRLGGSLHFDGQEIKVSINCRLVAPNRDATREAVKSDFQIFFQKLLRGSEYSLSYGRDPRGLFAVSVRASQPLPVADL